VRGRERLTGIFKEPLDGPVAIAGTTVGDDVQVDKRHHGGEYKAVYVYAIEDYEWWSRELSRAVGPGEFGDNITTRGLAISAALIGERWRLGTALVEVTDPRIPCSTLRSRIGEPGFVKRFARAERFGAYCKIVTEGFVSAGDSVVVVERPEHEVTIVDVARAYFSSDPTDMKKLYERAGEPEHFRARVEQ
jgi:MOSC domain-containing protein YiiM